MPADLTKQATAYLQANPQHGTKITGTLGSGYNGTAFLLDSGKVLKVTKDREEYQTAVKISSKTNGKFTPAYFAVDKLQGGLYVLVMEKVAPLQLTAQQSQMLNLFRDRILGMQEAGQDIRTILPALSKLPDAQLGKVLAGLINALHGLEKLGILNADIMEDNLAWRGQQLVLLDVVDSALVAETTYTKLSKLLRETLLVLHEGLLVE